MRAIPRVPGKYAGWLESGIRKLVEEIQIDEWRRDNGEKPLIPDTFLIDPREQDVFVMIGGASESVVETAAAAKRKRTA